MIVVADTETTGHDQEPALLQLAVYNPAGKHFNKFCRPTKPILPAAVAVHGITNQMAELFDPLEDLQAEFKEYVKDVLPPGVVVAGHQIDYDVEVMQRCVGPHPSRTLDTLRMARRLIPYHEIGGFRLDSVYVYLYPNDVEELMRRRTKHDAFDDCELTFEVFRGLKDLAVKKQEIAPGLNDLELKDWVDSPMVLSCWPFGKHRGRPFDYDESYARWYLKQRDTDQDIVHSIHKALGV